MDYTLAVDRQSVRIVDVEGHSLRASVFLRRASVHGFGGETLLERINDPTLFFLPCEIGDSMVLLNLLQVASIEMEGRPPEVAAMRETGCQEEEVELRMAGGRVLRGDLLYEAPQGSHRVSDLLNTQRPRFLVVVRDDSTFLVQGRAVLRVTL